MKFEMGDPVWVVPGDATSVHPSVDVHCPGMPSAVEKLALRGIVLHGHVSGIVPAGMVPVWFFDEHPVPGATIRSWGIDGMPGRFWYAYAHQLRRCNH